VLYNNHKTTLNNHLHNQFQ